MSDVDSAGTVPVIVPQTAVGQDDSDYDVEDQAVTDDLVRRARLVVAEHRRRTGRDITRDQLRAQLRVSNATAGELLRLIRAGSPVAPATRSITAPSRSH
jgi:hypothetical protein